MGILTSRDRIMIEGTMPERALLRLKRAKIDLYNVKKLQKNQILFSVSQKDSEKVFAIYPNVCYNISVYSPYTAKKIGVEGVARYVEWSKKRVGLLLGGLMYCITTLFFDGFVFGVDFVGTDIYAREVCAALESGGIQPFRQYKKGKEDWICSQVLALDGVEYCSVQKKGLRVVVEVRLSPFAKTEITKDSMYAKHTGTVAAITVLRGTACKKIGDSVTFGDMLVENAFYTQDGGQVRVEPIARATISCEYTAEIAAATEEEAFAAAYLQLALSDKDEIVKKEIEPLENATNGFSVRIFYTAIETINF